MFNQKEEKNVLANSKVEELRNLQKENKKIEDETLYLKNYLNQNVFNIANNKDENYEDIFEIKNSSIKFLEKIKDCDVLNANIPILEINNLTKYYPGKKMASLINLSLKLYLGDFHVVVGNYASGKTTLFKCIQEIEQYHGEILFDSSNYKENSLKVMDIVGFVPHNVDFDSVDTVEEIIQKHLKDLNIIETKAKKYIKDSLQQLGLEEIIFVKFIDLNLLEIKKLQIILSLINDPHLIVLDQPLLGLQYFEQIELLNILFKLKNKERAILIFSNEIEEFKGYANTISLLIKGKIYYSGPIQEILLNQKNKFDIKTTDNVVAEQILNDLTIKFSKNEIKDSIYVNFEGKINHLLFQQECSKQNILITEMKEISVEINELYPILLKIGNKNAIHEINKLKYFTPD